MANRIIDTGDYPADEQFQDSTLKSVRACKGGGWDVTQEEGWSLFIPAEAPTEPKAGSHLRLYGKGIGYAFRGMFLDGRKVFYRTEVEQARHHDETTFGADAAAYVAMWDTSGRVWSITMGGFGPGYEQALQLAMIEVLRHLVTTQPDGSVWRDEARPTAWRDQVDAMSAPLMPVLSPLGLSGAQWGAACSLAARLYLDGPIAVLKGADDDRKIQVSKSYPTLDPDLLAVLAEREAA